MPTHCCLLLKCWQNITVTHFAGTHAGTQPCPCSFSSPLQPSCVERIDSIRSTADRLSNSIRFIDAIYIGNCVLRIKYVYNKYCEFCRPARRDHIHFKLNSKTQKPTTTMTGREYTTICLLRWMKQFEMILICNMRTCTCNMRTCLSPKLAQALTKLHKSFHDE